MLVRVHGLDDVGSQVLDHSDRLQKISARLNIDIHQEVCVGGVIFFAAKHLLAKLIPTVETDGRVDIRRRQKKIVHGEGDHYL